MKVLPAIFKRGEGGRFARRWLLSVVALSALAASVAGAAAVNATLPSARQLASTRPTPPPAAAPLSGFS